VDEDVTRPVFGVTGGPNFLVLTGWGLCWLILSGALWTRPPAGNEELLRTGSGPPRPSLCRGRSGGR
jgi:hypothetical protein